MNVIDNSKIDNSNVLMTLHDYRKSLSLEQEEIDMQVTYHMGLLHTDETGNQKSQKNVVRSLTEKLTPFTFDASVKNLLETLNAFIENDQLFYDLEDLYRTLESSNQGMVYRHVMNIVLDIISEGNVRNQQIKILNELALHDWIPSVKNFIFKYTTNPRDRQNINSKGGKAEPVYTLVERLNDENNNGFLAFVGDKWFLINEKAIEPKTPSDCMTDVNKLRSLNYLQKALQISHVKDGKMIFDLDEALTLSVSISNGDIFLNDEKTDKLATLESVFDSALIPYIRKDLYPVVAETVKHIKKIVDLDIVQKVTNITNPCLECYAFNYKDKMYLYSIDSRYGNHFYEYDSATMLCNEMNNQLGYDLSEFLKNKFSKEIRDKKDLEGKEKFVSDKLEDVNENLSALKDSGLLEINEQIKTAFDVLTAEKESLEKDLFEIKSKLANG